MGPNLDDQPSLKQLCVKKNLLVLRRLYQVI